MNGAPTFDAITTEIMARLVPQHFDDRTETLTVPRRGCYHYALPLAGHAVRICAPA